MGMNIWTCWVDGSRRQTKTVDSSCFGMIRMHIHWPIARKRKREREKEWKTIINKMSSLTVAWKIILITQQHKIIQHHFRCTSPCCSAVVNKPEHFCLLKVFWRFYTHINKHVKHSRNQNLWKIFYEALTTWFVCIF